ncbi:unnamed protein product, partial [Effrenium voratum]
ERIALENERLRAELLELGSPGSQNGEVARNITAKIAALREDPASCKAIVTSHTPASPMSPTKEVWMDGSRMPELHAKITCDDLIPGAVADCDEASMISKDEPISEGTSAARLRSDRRISKGSRTEPPVEEPEEQVSRLIFLDVIPAVIISINAAVVGLSADICPEHTVWVGLEMFFTGFFTLEILVKMKVFGVKGYLWGADWYWSWFDCFCVLLAYLEMGMSLPTTGLGSSECGLRESDGGAGFGALKMLKLARLGRIVRLLKFKIFVELKLMIQGVFTGDCEFCSGPSCCFLAVFTSWVWSARRCSPTTQSFLPCRLRCLQPSAASRTAAPAMMAPRCRSASEEKILLWVVCG